MKQKIFIGGLLTVILSLSIACNQQKEEVKPVVAAVDAAQIKSEIQTIEDSFALTYNTKNVEDATKYYAQDAVSYFNNQLPIVGKAARDKFIMGELTNFPNGAKITFETIEVHPSNDGVHVLEIGNFKVVDSTDTKIRSGKYFSYFEKRDGKYVSIRDMSNSDPE